MNQFLKGILISVIFVNNFMLQKSIHQFLIAKTTKSFEKITVNKFNLLLKHAKNYIY